MATFDVIPLSGSTDGKNIKVAATETPGTLIHTGTTGSGNIDELELVAINTSNEDVTLTLEWGGVVDPDDLIIMVIPPKAGDFRISVSRAIQNGLLIRAFASVANVINIGGKIRRKTA